MANKETQIQKQESKDLQSIERTRWGKVFTPPVDIIETDNELNYLLICQVQIKNQ